MTRTYITHPYTRHWMYRMVTCVTQLSQWLRDSHKLDWEAMQSTSHYLSAWTQIQLQERDLLYLPRHSTEGAQSAMDNVLVIA